MPKEAISKAETTTREYAGESNTVNDVTTRHRRYAWAELLKRVFAVDVLKCDKCGGRMKILCAVNPPVAIRKIRGSLNTRKELKAAHMVSAWATENRMVLAQVKANDKSNEITAIPELLSMLALKGAIVTIDAMGCQYKIANQIVAAE